MPSAAGTVLVHHLQLGHNAVLCHRLQLGHGVPCYNPQLGHNAVLCYNPQLGHGGASLAEWPVSSSQQKASRPT